MVSLDGEDLRLLFTTSTGLPLRGNSFSHSWQRAIKAAGLPGVNFHMPRHTYASLLIAQNLSPKKIQVRWAMRRSLRRWTRTATCTRTMTTRHGRSSTRPSGRLLTRC